MGSSLILRRAADGSTRVQGEPPAGHVFPTAFLARELATGLAEVTVTLHTTAGDVTYRMTGFDQLEAPTDEDPAGTRANVTGWVCEKVED